MGVLIDSIPVLQTNIMRIIWWKVRRITSEILGVKGITTRLTTAVPPFGEVPYTSQRIISVKETDVRTNKIFSTGKRTL